MFKKIISLLLALTLCLSLFAFSTFATSGVSSGFRTVATKYYGNILVFSKDAPQRA